MILISSELELREAPKHKLPQVLPSLPVAVSGQLTRLEEIDRYAITAPKTGPIRFFTSHPPWVLAYSVQRPEAAS